MSMQFSQERGFLLCSGMFFHLLVHPTPLLFSLASHSSINHTEPCLAFREHQSWLGAAICCRLMGRSNNKNKSIVNSHSNYLVCLYIVQLRVLRRITMRRSLLYRVSSLKRTSGRRSRSNWGRKCTCVISLRLHFRKGRTISEFFRTHKWLQGRPRGNLLQMAFLKSQVVNF